MSSGEAAAFLAALGFGGALVAVINAVFQRRKVGADATAVVTAAARELVDPLRKELAHERATHAAEVDLERRKVAEVRSELLAMTEEAKQLRFELGEVRRELDRAWAQIAEQRRQLLEYETGGGARKAQAKVALSEQRANRAERRADIAERIAAEATTQTTAQAQTTEETE